jgi:L-ascorbate metabolism protein UlaG (beta-lactamase superfamily)
MRSLLVILLFIIAIAASGCVQNNQPGGETMHEINVKNVTITWLGHASFRIDGSKTVYVDPFVLPSNAKPADYILVTHEHFDHCDVSNINKLKKNDTQIIAPLNCVKNITGHTNSISVGESSSYKDGVRVAAVEAYNINKSYHPKGLGVGFVLTIDNVKIYHAGDTDNIPEMKSLSDADIDIALLPIGGKYTMNVAEAAEAAQSIKPKIVVPMHYNSDKYGVAGINANPAELAKALVGKVAVTILSPLV